MRFGWNRSRPSAARVGLVALAALTLSGGAALSGCGSSGSPGAGGSGSALSGSCVGVPGAHHARLVVDPPSGKVLRRCVGFGGKSIPALKLLSRSRVEAGTQNFSFGVGICQVDNVPAHYTKCFPTGQDYWAVFLSTDGRHWTSPSVGVSEIKVPPGGSLGLRYDPPTGKAAPPPRPTPA
jgi:hypothetical protein